MRIKLKKLLYKGMSFGYIYDYGSSTEIEIKVIHLIQALQKIVTSSLRFLQKMMILILGVVVAKKKKLQRYALFVFMKKKVVEHNLHFVNPV